MVPRFHKRETPIQFAVAVLRCANPIHGAAQTISA
uniref:Uncharacterized protein n=1 Tax=Arundo donax TaxID=35708 RepID=A0A0A9FSI5_ARUDO